MFAHIPSGEIERAATRLCGLGLLVVLGAAGLIWLVVWLVNRSRGPHDGDGTRPEG